MVGLNSREKAGCRQLLGEMETPDLMSLAETVTNRMIQVYSRGEALDAILTYSETAADLLRRKKVYRDVIFKYLASKKITMAPSSDKNQLIQRALEFWTESGVSSAPKRNNGDKQISMPSQVRSITMTWSQIQHCPAEGVAETFQSREKEKSNDPSHRSSLDCYALGEHFCRWFYELLNSQNPTLGLANGEWGLQHFWENAMFKFAYRTIGDYTEEHCGALMTSLRLLALTREERLLFNPNIASEGLKCATCPYGLVVVAVAGTIHKDNQYLGLFEHIFGLIRCPATDKWKIKNVNLNILGQSAMCSSALRPSIQYKISDLEKFYN
ncbi:uncharacterized protein C3orf38 homolog [Xenopus laevis]|uniref:Uncharacterized protein C3orf38 homolog n=2 Tax=Xenopus laevis TaxID=8355 RepID=A0A1L8HCZ6_XENLA|nr:uncharacterized protein C3orf38 homolog [Xenopus laevis]OCT93891.1 hypothetical protein XELAEV_18011562mg [Xenopus laevis]